MSFKVLIPAAGTGSRLGEICKYINKSLVSVGNRPAICHIIEKFADNIPFVIALGYKGAVLREFLELVYPERTFEFVEVSPFEGPGSGLGLSVLACRSHLQCPFIFSSCDTLVAGPIPPPDENWVGYSKVENADAFRTIALRQSQVAGILEKRTPGADPLAYIGLAGIKDHDVFWAAMLGSLDGTALEQGESFGLRQLLGRGLVAHQFQWYDTGSRSGLEAVRAALQRPDAPNILPKANEDIWFVGNSVIKFSADPGFIADRVKRSRLLEGFCPKIEGSSAHMYKYSRVEGEVLSKTITQPLFRKLLDHSSKFWKVSTLTGLEAEKFEAVCLDFYQTKTYQRLEQFYKNFDRKDSPTVINGLPVPSNAELLAQVDWKWLSKGLPGDFHGDFHFENILFSKKEGRFVFLDWRQNFGGLMAVGDIYYDLAKLNHGLIVCHDLVARDLFEVTEGPEEVRFELLRKQSLVECERLFEEFLQASGYDLRRVKIMTALIYLNIAALHHYPYSLLLYYLGRSMLADVILNRNAKNI